MDSHLKDYESSPDEAAHFDHIAAHVRLGKLEKKEDARNLQLGKYLTLAPAALPKPPPKINWSHNVATWPMYANDRLGDCTCAAAGHIVESATGGAGRPVVPSEQSIVDLYWATGSADDGRYCLDVLNYWRSNGIGGRNAIHAFAEVDVKNHVEVEQALALFGNLYMGVALPLSAQRRTSWTKSRSLTGVNKPGSWGGHCINAVDYVAPRHAAAGLTIVTWGTLLHMDWGFLDQYCDEMYVVLTKDWLDAAGNSPLLAGALNLAALEKDLAAL